MYWIIVQQYHKWNEKTPKESLQYSKIYTSKDIASDDQCHKC